MVKVLFCPQMADLARQLCEKNDICQPWEISWKNFKDGFPDLKVRNAAELRNSHAVFLASFDHPAEIFRQLSLIYELPRLLVKSLKVFLPYYSTGTMERVEKEGEIATASSMARMLSNIPGTLSGPVQIIIYDIHALQERFYFSDQVIPRLETAVPLLLKRINNIKNLAVAFPDEGAWKRFGRMFNGFHLITAQKIRENNRRKVSIKEGDPAGKHVIIVDDLVMTGETLMQCRNTLMDAGAKKVSAYVTHGVFPGDSWKKFTGPEFNSFWMTDSCPVKAGLLKGKKPFEILSLAGHISDEIISDI